MRDKINEFSQKKPTFWGQGSIARAFLQSVAYIATFIQLQINICYQAFRTVSARGFHLDRRMEDFDLERRLLTNTLVVQTFYGEDGRVDDIVLPEGLVVKTAPDLFGNVLSYELVEDIVLTSDKESVTGTCQCTQAGKVGNTTANTIVLFDSTPAGIESTTNLEDVSNGAEIESDDDFKARLPAKYLSLRMANGAAIESAAYGVEGISYVKILENHPAAGNFSLFVSTDSGIVDSILREKVRLAVEAVRAFCITFSIIIPTVQNITIEFDALLNTNDYNTEALQLQMKTELFNFVNNLRRSSVYVSDVIALLRQVSGVLNIKAVEINGVADDLTLIDLYVAKIEDLSDITINLL